MSSVAMHHNDTCPYHHALFLSLLFLFLPRYAQSFRSHTSIRTTRNTGGLRSATHPVRIVRGNDFHLCGGQGHSWHAMEHCPFLPVMLPYATLLIEHMTPWHVCPPIFQMIQRWSEYSHPTLSRFHASQASLPFPIGVQVSERASLPNCPSVFERITIHYSPIYCDCHHIIRRVVKGTKMAPFYHSIIPSLSSMADIPTLDWPSFVYLQCILVSTSPISPSLSKMPASFWEKYTQCFQSCRSKYLCGTHQR
jgi:hypothetical protein